MAKKPRNAAVDFGVFLAIRLLVCIVQALPMSLAFALADGLAILAHRFDRRHRAVAAENLSHAFPELADDPDRLDRLVRGVYAHFSRMLVEIILLPRKLRIGNWRRYANAHAGKAVVRALLRDRPLMFVTGHFGNWEVSGYILGVFGIDTFAIARVLDNPYLERFLKRFRQRTGQTMIAKKADYDRLMEVMRHGGRVGSLADQDAGSRGLFVPFFGRPASTHKAVALMAMEFDALLLVFAVPRVGEAMQFSLTCEDEIDPRDYAGRADAVEAITARYNAALERLIRRHPEQYFWLHRRWKSQPAVKGKRLAGAKAA